MKNGTRIDVVEAKDIRGKHKGFKILVNFIQKGAIYNSHNIANQEATSIQKEHFSEKQKIVLNLIDVK